MTSRNWRRIDWLMTGAFLLLCLLGTMEVYYSTAVNGYSPFLGKHLFKIGVGLAFFLVVLVIDYRLILSHITLLYILGNAVLVYVLFFGVEIRSSKSWIQLAGLAFQPSELMKIILILALTRFLSEQTDRYLMPRAVLLAGGIVFLPVSLIFLQHDLGTALTIMPVFFTMLLLGGIRRKVVIISVLILGLLLGGSWFVLQNYQKERILVIFNPERDPNRMGYQTIQSVIAVGAGGFTGRGLGQGSQGALGFLPERHTDFIFSVVAEEMGFLGSMLVLLLYAFIFFRGLQLAYQSRDRSISYLAAGIVTLYAVHLAINVGMALGLMPVIGIPLPPLSYGGSSLVTSFASLALLNNCRLNRYFM